MTSCMAPTLVRHRMASGWSTEPRVVEIVWVPVRRSGAAAMESQRLASVARSGPKRKHWDRVRPVPRKAVMMSRAPRHW